MIEQSARVLAVHDGLAEIETVTQSACGHCQVSEGCGTGLVARWFPDRARTRVRLPVGHLRPPPQPGDRVILGIEDGWFRRHVLLLYLLPLVGLIAGALAGEALWTRLWPDGNGEPGAVFGGLSGLSAALFAVRALGRNPIDDPGSRIRVLRVEARAPALSVHDLGIGR